MRNATFENQDTLQVAADELKLFVEKSDFFSRDSGKGFFNNPAIRGTAFSDEVLKDNKNSEVIEVTPTEFIVIRKLDYQAEQPKALDDIKVDITSALKNELAAKQANQNINDSYAAIIESDDWDKGLQDFNLSAEPKTVSYLDQEAGIPFPILSEIYSSSDANFDTRIGKAFDLDGNGYLFKLNEIRAGDKSALTRGLPCFCITQHF